jgi:UDP-2,4-diacetamido-2,4,6-trideoxy-beta-L-altropyranose hydrolase
MVFVFRVDASDIIGTGHVMRCLTLALFLRSLKHNCIFICRKHPKNLIPLIKSHGFEVFELPTQDSFKTSDEYASWLGVEAQLDAEKTIDAISHLNIDWLIIDHYGIDARWHMLAGQATKAKILVLDDLANRDYYCDILIDQNLHSNTQEYIHKVPSKTKLLMGTKYALLREEFLKNRLKTINTRRSDGPINKILIAFGGVDIHDYSSACIRLLSKMRLAPHVRVTVLLGQTAQHIENVKKIIEETSLNMQLIHDSNRVADILIDTDICIGASGSMSWERFCLGVPSIQLTTANNQQRVSAAIQQAKAAKILLNLNELSELQLTNLGYWHIYGKNAAKLVDGEGVKRIFTAITDFS